MKLNIKKLAPLALIVMLPLSVTSCIEEGVEADLMTGDQVAASSTAQEELLWGISNYMVKYNAWNGSDYLNDWGYPCQIYFRELCGADFPVYKSTYDYWTYYENCSYCSSYPYYTWNYYYRLIKNCNLLVEAVDKGTSSTASNHYKAQALAFRAMAYLDIARMFEFKPTGFTALDAKAETNGIWGLTVPIVTEKTSSQEILDNPRADFCTMYRFIMTDLNEAAKLLGTYEPSDKSLPGIHAVYGLMARAWMEIGSRYEETTPQLQGYIEKMKESNKQDDGYDAITALTAYDAYSNALTCAEKAMEGYTPVTSDQWHSKTEGFNTANQAWIWRCRIGGKEQFPAYYCSFLGQTASEPSAALARYADAYRCISSQLYSKIGSNDWRKTSWIAPTDAGKTTQTILDKYLTLLPDSEFAKMPKYANLKFRPGSGNIDDYNTWLICDMPVMRMEEMEFVKMEAIARTQGFEAGHTELKEWLNTNRYTKATYKGSSIVDLPTFLTEMEAQKRIEFWGEGICFFDLKRMNMVVDRTTSNNVEDAFMVKSREGYACPWMNFFIMQYETNRNAACKANPDVSGYYDVASDEE